MNNEEYIFLAKYIGGSCI